MTTISVAIAGYNEEPVLSNCLKSVAGWVKEIIVVDPGSTDKTPDIARKYGAVVIRTSKEPMFHRSKQLAINRSTGDWILQLDADEVVTGELKKEILQVISSPQAVDGYWIPRKNYFLGTYLTKGGQYPDYTLRLYRRGKGRLPCISVHEQAVVSGVTRYLRHPLMHHAYPDFHRYLDHFNRYTDYFAQELQRPRPASYLVALPLFWFLKTYFRHRGYKDGFPGFVYSWFSSLRFPVSYIKYWEKHRVRR